MSPEPTSTVVITGAGSGIGRCCAERMAARGLHVIGAGRTQATLDESFDAIREAGGAGTMVVADCGTDAGRAALVETVRAAGQPVAAFVHAAGADLVASLGETSAAQLDELLEVNVRAPFLLTQALVPMLTDGAGIVYVGSISATRGRARHSAYGASKAALIGLTANLAVELGPAVRVNCVSPGATRTGMLRAYVRASIARPVRRGAFPDGSGGRGADAARARRRARRGGHRLRPPRPRCHRHHRRGPAGRRRLHRQLTSGGQSHVDRGVVADERRLHLPVDELGHRA